jgi:hypothetical protein
MNERTWSRRQAGRAPSPEVSRRTVLAVSAAAAVAAGMPVVFTGGAPVNADPAQPETAFDAARFADPRGDSRPTVLWFWNGTVTPDLVNAQLADMRDKGVTEVLLFPFDTAALRPLFFSEEWFAIVEHALREALRLGMHVWLFNDDFFPSGRGGGFVVNGGRVGDRVYPARPDLRPRGIVRTTTVATGGSVIVLAGRGLTVLDGRLVVDAAARDGVTLLRDGADWQDYDVSATVRVERSTAGLMVRCADESNGYLADLRADGGVDLWRQTGGTFTLLRQGQPRPGFDPAADHTFTVRVRGDRIVPSIDGTVLPEVVDGTHTAGRVGVRSTGDQRSSWDDLEVTGADGRQLFTEDFADPDALTAFDLPADVPPPIAAAARPADGAADVGALVDLTELARAGGEWTVPDGRWQVEVFTTRPLAETGTFRRNYLDLLDDEAVELFLDVVPGEYLRRFPWAVGSVLRGFADDEPFLPSADAHFRAVPWSRSLDAELDRLGVSPGVVLCAVHDDLGQEGLRLRGAFWRAVSDRFASAYYRQQGEWMAERGLVFLSNPLWDEYGPAEHVKSTGNLNTLNQWAQTPGTDLVFDHYRLGYHRMLSRWPASTAHQLGKERVYLEAMGAMGWGVTPALTREVIGAFAVRGVNHTTLHASFTDSATIFYPPPFQPVNPWWDLSAPLNEWIGRVMEVGRSTARAHTALLQPQRAAESHQDTPALVEIDAAFVRAAHALEDVQVDFDLVDEGALNQDPALLEHARTQGHHLVVGRQEYGIVVLPWTPMLSIGTVTTLTRFVRAGGTVVLTGERPEQEAGGDHAALARALGTLLTHSRTGRVLHAQDPDEAAALVVSAGGAAANLSPRMAEVRVLRLDRDGERAFLVTNERSESVTVTATFPATGVPEIWDPDSGRATRAGVWREAPFTGSRTPGTALPLHLEPKATLLIVFRRPRGRTPAHAVSATAAVERIVVNGKRASATVGVSTPTPVRVIATDGQHLYRGGADVRDEPPSVVLDGEWDLRFDRANAPVVRRPLGSWTDLDPAYSGSAFYQREFDLDARVRAHRRWMLDLGEVREVAEIQINGTDIGSRLWPPYRLDVTDVLRDGHNTIRVRVTNTGANVRGESLPSGLLGPAVLRSELSMEVPLTPARGRVLDIDAASFRVAPGQPRPSTVRVRDLSGRSGQVQLNVSGQGVTVSPTSVQVDLDGNGEGTADIVVDAPVGTSLPGAATVVVSAEGERHRLPVTLLPATRLGAVRASSSHPAHPAATVNDGVTESSGWDAGQGWNDGTPNAYPDDVTVTFDLPAVVGRVRIYTLDSSTYPAAEYGVTDADVLVLVNGEWQTVGQVRGNEQGRMDVVFPAVRAEAIRLVVVAARVSYTRVIELEALPR